MRGYIARAGRHGIGRERSKLSRGFLQWAFQHEEIDEQEPVRFATGEENERRAETMRPKPSDYDIDGVDQALADLAEMGLVVDSGKRRFQGIQ